eukprot:m.28263 g.28263  ORF g.28263 m.28263 type:complete len:640 (+) comp6526_c0_seq1:11-1930(+)
MGFPILAALAAVCGVAGAAAPRPRPSLGATSLPMGDERGVPTQQADGVGGAGKHDPPVVTTTSGAVRGFLALDGAVEVFHSVPFASPPLSHHRWTAPTQPEPWNDVRDATTVHPECPQWDLVRLVHLGEEDCLYLSVYKPTRCTPANPCPVMQWIYGGAWIVGSNYDRGSYNATAFANKHGVVVVAANYRLDVLGWLALDELQQQSPTGTAGNFGLMDQTFALKWTQANAAAFGGIPTRVTIFGESAGGFSVCQHLTHPRSNGLFSHAVIESGGCDGPWAIYDAANSKRWGDYYTEKVGCPATAVPGERVGCLREKKLNELMEPYIEWLCPVPRPDDPWCNRSLASHPRLARPGNNRTMGGERAKEGGIPGAWPNPRPPMAPIVGWAATVDGTYDGLPESPYSAMLAGRVNRGPNGEPVSVIIGTNADEMALFIAATGITFNGATLPVTRHDVDLAAQHLVDYHQPTWNQSVIHRVIGAYDGPDFQNAHAAWLLTVMGTDFLFLCQSRLSAAALAAAGVKVYVYLFDFHAADYKDPKSLGCELLSEVGCGVQHAQEIKYIFGQHDEGAPRAVSAAMNEWWANLAIHGDPNGKTPTGTLPVWPAYSKEAPRVMTIDENPKVASGLPRYSRCEVWDALPRF